MPPMLDMSFSAVRTWLNSARRPLLLSHQRPDGDALGSLAGLAGWLRAEGAAPTILLFDPFPARYGFLRGDHAWANWADTDADAVRAGADSIIIVDTCALAQLEPAVEYLRAAPRTLVIDHHATRDPIGVRPGDQTLFDETAGACALLIAELAQAAGRPPAPAEATALFTGIATDTGWFRFSNTDARLLRMAAELVAAGATPQAIAGVIYQREPAAKLRLIARMLQSLALHADGRLVTLHLRLADFAAAGADPGMTEDLVNEATRVDGCDTTILFIETEEGGVRVNFRSRERLDVAALASRFGGGGHARAAGARPHGAWDNVVPRITREAAEALGQLFSR